MKMKLTILVVFILLISCQYALALTPSDNEVNSWVGTPVSGFIENKGQLCDMNYQPAPYLLFKLQQPGTDVYITGWGLSYVFHYSEENPNNSAAGLPGSDRRKDKLNLPDDKFKPKDIITHYCRADMELVGADIRKENILKEYESADYYNYYLSHCPDGVMEVRSYGKLTIKEVYPGIDWVIYNTTSNGMKYDFVVHPYADPSQIKIRYKWADKPSDNEGSLEITTPLGKITESKPYACNSWNSVNVSYCIEDGDISFHTETYNITDTLILDPQLLWATFYGGNAGDEGESIHCDGTSVWVTGQTSSTNFPIQILSGAYNQGTSGGFYDVFILKFSTSGVRQWATYYGGNGDDDEGWSIISDGTSVWVTGTTNSTNLPLQNLTGAYNQGTLGGGYYDAFILKFSTSGVRQWATYYGGNGSETGFSIYSDGTSVWVTGQTYSTDFPVQSLSGAYNQGTSGGSSSSDAFILKFSTSGLRQWATYYGGNGTDAGYSVNSDGTSVWVTGNTYSTNFPLQSLSGAYNQGTLGGVFNDYDAFILKFSTSGVRQWATYYGGGTEDAGTSIYSDGTSVWLTGWTGSANFPLQSLSGAYNQGTLGGSEDVFILKFSTSGVRQWATYYGGNGSETGNSIHSDGISVWVTGYTHSTNFPVQSLTGAYNQGAYGGGTEDAFILEFNTSCLRQWATYYGGNNDDYGNFIYSDGANVWVTGETVSTNFPLQNLSGAYNQGTLGAGQDAFILDFTALTGIRPISSIIPSSFKLYNNYPNPFNPTTKIKFDIPPFMSPLSERGVGGVVTLKLYDLLGHLVATLVNEKLSPGTYEVSWDASNFPSGVYFYRLTSDNFMDTKKMLLVK
jgi:hypothetical protein